LDSKANLYFNVNFTQPAKKAQAKEEMKKWLKKQSVFKSILHFLEKPGYLKYFAGKVIQYKVRNALSRWEEVLRHYGFVQSYAFRREKPPRLRLAVSRLKEG